MKKMIVLLDNYYYCREKSTNVRNVIKLVMGIFIESVVIC